jgi:hypothetical protein
MIFGSDMDDDAMSEYTEALAKAIAEVTEAHDADVGSQTEALGAIYLTAAGDCCMCAVTGIRQIAEMSEIPTDSHVTRDDEIGLPEPEKKDHGPN